MFQRLKAYARDLVPARLQVPVKYAFAIGTGSIEPEMALLPALVGSGDRVIDVGGNRGLYVYRLARLGAQVEVFEPNPACHRPLSAWAKHRRGVAIHAVALSASDGEGELLVPLGEDGVEHDSSGSLEHGTEGPVRQVAVQLRTLDSFDFTGIALIKIDVEGHEGSVIAGAHRTIAASKPALLVEIEQRHLSRPIADMFGEIAAMGYDGFFLKDDRLVPLAEFDVSVDQSVAAFDAGSRYFNNFLFLATERVARGDYVRVLADRNIAR